MSHLNDGLISIKKGHNYCIRNTINNIGWERIKPNNLLFIYGHPLHYDITKSEISIVKDDFIIEAKQPVQMNFALKIGIEHSDYYFIKDSIVVYFKDQEVKRYIRNIERNSDSILIHLNEPLFFEGSALLSGEGSIVTSKNKISFNSNYIENSVYEGNYYVAQDFTKNLSLPLMETNDSPIAGLYNRSVKVIDQAVEHSRLSVPNLICKTELLEINKLEHEFSFNPPLDFQPQIFSQIINIVNKNHYSYGYSIYNITPSGYKLHIDHPVKDSLWNLNAIIVPDHANYEKLFLGFKTENKKESLSNIFYLEVNEPIIKNDQIISLYKSFPYRIKKLICKTDAGSCKFSLQVNDKETNIVAMANPSKYTLPLKNPIIVDKEETLSLHIDKAQKHKNFSLVLECEIL